MSRFYKTASAKPMDYIVPDNIPLMQQSLLTNDKYITDAIDASNKIGDFDFGRLEPDEEETSKILNEYKAKAESLSKSISEDSANWRNKMSDIKNLSEDLASNYKSGKISKILGNYNAYKDWENKSLKLVEQWQKFGGAKGGVSPEEFRANKEFYLKKFRDSGGTNYESTDKYNVLNVDDLMPTMDIKKIASEALDKIKADKSYKYREDEAGNGWYTNKETNKEERITPEKVWGIAWDNIKSNPQALNYLSHNSQIGLTKGIYNDKGEFINPFLQKGITPEQEQGIDYWKSVIDKEQDPTKKSKLKENLDAAISNINTQTTLNPDSYFHSILEGLGNTYSYISSENGNTLKNSNKANAIENLKIKRDALNETIRNNNLKADIANRKFEWDKLPKDKDGNVIEKPGSNSSLSFSLSEVPMNPFVINGDMGIKSASDLVTQLNNFRNRQDVLTKQINEETNEDIKNILRYQLQTVNDNLFQVRDYYGKALDAAKSQAMSNGDITINDLKIYDDVIDKDNPRAYIAKKQGFNPNTTNPYELAIINSIGKSFTKTKTVIDKHRDDFITKLNKTGYSMKSASTNEAQNNIILQNIETNPSLYKFIDPKNGGDAKDSDYYIDHKTFGKNVPLTMEDVDDNGISIYLKSTGKKLSDIVDILGTTLPQKLGGSNSPTTRGMVRVKFKSDVGNVGGKEFYIPMPEDLQSTIAKDYLNSTDQNSKAFGQDLSNGHKNNFLNTLKRADQLSHELTDDNLVSTPVGQVTIPFDNGFQTFRATPKVIGDKKVYYGEVLINGKFVPIQTTKKFEDYYKIKRNGNFDSLEDMYNVIFAPENIKK